jgi:flagellar protein FlgJ
MTEQLNSVANGFRLPAAKQNSTAAAGPETLSEEARRLKKACEDMESLFVHQLIKEMRATIPKSGLFGKSQAQDIYTGMLDGQLAQEIARGRGLGLSALLMRQMGGMADPGDENDR